MFTTDLKINKGMLSLARESRGLNQKELADLLGISAGKLCRVEQDDQSFTDEIIERLSDVLQYPRSLFYQIGESYLPNSIDFRRRLKVSNKILKEIDAKANLYRLNIEKIVTKASRISTLPIINIDENTSPTEAAIQLRKYWKMPEGPVESVTEILESKGILIIEFDFGTERVDSRVVITQSKNGVIVLNKLLLGDRQRFSLAYEVGHLVMHVQNQGSLGKKDIGHEANIFAAEFLMPQQSILNDLEGEITIAKLAELKRKWKVSMQALLYRAEDLNILTYNQKRYLLSQFNAMNIRRREPPEFDVLKERPTLLTKSLNKYKEMNKMTSYELAESFHLTPEELTQKYSLDA